MGRSPCPMNRESSVNTEEVDAGHPTNVKEEQYDVKLEDVSLSVPTSSQTNSNFDPPPKMKRTRTLFSHLSSVKEETLNTFTQIKWNIYQDEELGESSQQVDVMSCECKPSISG